MSMDESELKEVQIYLISKTDAPLNYHFDNFSSLEKKAKPSNLENWEEKTEEERLECFNSKDFIKYEIEAYVSKLGKFAKSCFVLSKEFDIKKPQQMDLLYIWNSLRDGGVVKELRDKWAAHRSYDDPRGFDTDKMHMEVMFNLEGPMTYWEGDKCIFLFQELRFDLHDYHPKFLLFLKWFVSEIETKLETLSN